MSFDLKLQRTCDHVIFDEEVSVEGLSPNYFSTLNYKCDGSSNFVTVREFSKTEGLSNFVYSRDGFTNWTLSADNTYLNWGAPQAGMAGFLEAASMILPQPTMLVSYRAHPDFCPLCI